MKISKIIIFITGIVFCYSCNFLYAEIIHGDNENYLYVKSFATPLSNSNSSKTVALSKAELNAQKEFARYAVAKKIILPSQLDYLSNRIKDNIIFSQISGIVKGSKVLKSLMLKDGRACCVIEFPKSNIDNFPTIDYRKDYKRLLNDLKRNRLLQFEVATALKYMDSDIFSNFPHIISCKESKSLSCIPESWLLKDFNIEVIKSLNDDELILIMEGFIGNAKIIEEVLSEIYSRGFKNTHSVLSKIKLPVSTSLNIIVSIDESDEIELVKILLKEKSSIKFENSKSANNEEMKQALAEFSSSQPNFIKVRNYALKSLVKSVSDDAFNLIGRTFEEEKKWNQAVLFYAQAISINIETPYAKANLAKSFYELGNYKLAIYWAEQTLSSSNVPDWSKQRANEILTLIKSNEKK